jgi:hypothetical protein
VAGYQTLFIIKQAGEIYTSVLSSSLGDFEFSAGFCFLFGFGLMMLIAAALFTYGAGERAD